MRRSRLAVTFSLLVVSLSSFALAVPIGISDYSGPRFPYSASLNAGTTLDSGLGVRFGYWLEDTGLRAASHFHGDSESTAVRLHMVASATDPTVVYLEDFDGIVVIRFDGDHWARLYKVQFHRPLFNTFVDSFVAVISDRAGSDIVFFRVDNETICAILDTDGDRLADKVLDRNGDTFDDLVKFGDFSIAAIGQDGTAYGFDPEARPLPEGNAVFALTIRDTDGDFIPDKLAWPEDSRGRLEISGLHIGFAYGSADSGTGRLVLGTTRPSLIDLDADGYPIPSSYRELAIRESDPDDRSSIYTYDPQQLLHDGSMAAYWAYFYDLDAPQDTNHGIYVLDDVNFDGVFTIKPPFQGSELLPALTEKMFEPREFPGTPLVPELTELRSFSGGRESITFADFGIWPDGRPFSFRQAGAERSAVSVSLSGLLSFVGPVSATPSLAALDATPGLLAPAWSDQWDTSQVRVFAGCAPTQRRFADGSGSAARSFVIEWRGLVSPNGKRTSLRCLLLEDGSFRVDYGAMEIGSMPLVVGYSTDGAGQIVSDDLSDNSWGGLPTGTLEEAKLGEEFGAAKPFALQHKWIRFAGYGDVRGPRPEIIGVALKKGNKIQMRAPGSNIQTGATLVVDGTETFELAKSATGSKWVVSKKATSAPGSKSVESIWNDGQPHSIVVVNPDGGRSTTTELQ